jgi:hypothetical protein
LQWTQGSDSRIVGYRVYWGTSSRSYQQPPGQGVGAGQSSSYIVGNLTVNRTYYFAVTAYDAAGNESAYSAEATKTVR